MAAEQTVTYQVTIESPTRGSYVAAVDGISEEEAVFLVEDRVIDRYWPDAVVTSIRVL